MGLLLPSPGFQWSQTNETAPTTTLAGVQVASGSSANTKNTTYTELIAALTYDCYQLDIWMSNVTQSTTDTGLLVDIAIGAVSSETVIISNLNAGAGSTLAIGGGQKYRFPLYIPAGSRLSATAQGVQTSDTVDVWVRAWGRPRFPTWAGQRVVTYGADTADSHGVTIVTGDTGEGSWTEIVSSTTADHQFVTGGISIPDTGIGTQMYLADVGVGAGGSEVAIGSDTRIRSSTSEEITQYGPLEAWSSIPAGSRLSVRIHGSGSATDLDAILYGVS